MGIFGKPPESKPDDQAVSKHLGASYPAPPAASPAPRGSAPCIIGPKIVVKGEITGEEDVVIEGTVEGQIRVGRDLRIAPGAMVKAAIAAQTVVVSGEVVGDCDASNRVEIQATGRLTGNIRAPKIVIAEGAMFKGNSDMSGRKEERKDKIALP